MCQVSPVRQAVLVGFRILQDVLVEMGVLAAPVVVVVVQQAEFRWVS